VIFYGNVTVPASGEKTLIARVHVVSSPIDGNTLLLRVRADGVEQQLRTTVIADPDPLHSVPLPHKDELYP
jgi:hypothetical protein